MPFGKSLSEILSQVSRAQSLHILLFYPLVLGIYFQVLLKLFSFHDHHINHDHHSSGICAGIRKEIRVGKGYDSHD
jgi:hypothetical protein